MAQYTEQQRIEALAQLELNGGDVSKAARAAGVARTSLIRWRDECDKVSGKVGHPKIDFVGLWADAVQEAIAKARELMRGPDVAFRDVAVFAGIANDKLMDHRDGRKGGVSVNVDNRSINLPPDLSVDELRRLASGDDE